MARHILLIMLFLTGLGGWAQIPRASVTENLQVFPPEQVRLSVNSEVLLAGESLRYKAYLLNSSQGKSQLSKRVYVSLRNEEDSVVFSHKLKVKNAGAQGGFFIPSSLKSGVYRLIGYTNFSRNNPGNRAYFQKNVLVLNTFLNPEGYPKAVDTLSVDFVKPEGVESLKKKNNTDPLVQIKTDQQAYGLREKVNVSLLGNAADTGGEYVLSVRKVNPLSIDWKANGRTAPDTSDVFYLPEVRGEIISGQVLQNGRAVENQAVSLTIAGDDFIFMTSKTNPNGRFFFAVDEAYSAQNCTVQIVKDKGYKPSFSLHMDDRSLPLGKQEKRIIKLDPKMEAWLRERSVAVQIENAYFDIKKDSLLPISSHSLFFDGLGTVYNLDDYTRFPSVRETFVEVISSAAVRGSGSDAHFLVYNEYDPNRLAKFNDLPPLVLLDGFQIQDSRLLLDYNARDIKSVRVISTPYRYGPKIYSGIISVETIKGDFQLPVQDYSKVTALPPPVTNKLYYRPNYGSGTQLKRIPDYREQLLWQPQIQMADGRFGTAFYTSDVPGIFEIRLEGFTGFGEYVLAKEYFVVAEK